MKLRRRKAEMGSGLAYLCGGDEKERERDGGFVLWYLVSVGLGLDQSESDSVEERYRNGVCVFWISVAKPFETPRFRQSYLTLLSSVSFAIWKVPMFFNL